eukprot:gnl/TRDRNA2_/TRDRNA2_33837_c0_seq1.p1 gnl/TRDRNA2_/TRDRNA2_33837_c0~~gnl/TRDRNA2_/TRDRNA2_33837_c0_seq1.p1  ORF type:complete len:309 (-),score=43.16 gnl/TRDRNA2_/TRDRNA2_33837_c0_seq1:73-969(-)
MDTNLALAEPLVWQAAGDVCRGAGVQTAGLRAVAILCLIPCVQRWAAKDRTKQDPIVAASLPPIAESYYELLTVSPSASADEIRKAYRTQALKWHPDKQDSDNRPYAEQRFKLISEAYEILSDPQKRETYDRFGKDGLERGGSAEMSTAGFPSAFGGFSGFGGPGVRVVFSQPGGSFFGSGAGFSSAFGGAGLHDPFDLFRSVFGGDPFMTPSFDGASHFAGGARRADEYDEDEEVRRALEMSKREEAARIRETERSMQAGIGEKTAYEEAVRRTQAQQRSAEERDLEAAIQASLQGS